MTDETWNLENEIGQTAWNQDLSQITCQWCGARFREAEQEEPEVWRITFSCGSFMIGDYSRAEEGKAYMQRIHRSDECFNLSQK